jgi:alpha-tubulin suppressor-like RCC1 family protein
MVGPRWHRSWGVPASARRRACRVSAAVLVFTVIGVVWASGALAVVGISNARQVVGGDLHACALIAGGRVQCWGDNSYGELGDGTETERTAPVAVTGITTATQVSAGGDHTCALLTGGSVACWGYNGDGQLGDGTTTDRLRPVPVEGISRATMISAGFYETCALLAGGTVRCWGGNADGDLGDGTTRGPDKCGLDQCSRRPVAVHGITHATSITVGAFHACAALANGDVKCWGFNYYGQLGDGTRTNRATPVAVAGITTATSVSASTLQSCALLAGGAVACWGDNKDGQLGDDTLTGPARCGDSACSTTPVRVIGITGATQISAGGDTSEEGDGDHACAVLSGGTVKCWGANYSGELGDGAIVDRSTPVSVRGVRRATQVTAGGYASCAVFGTGRITCWGDNSSGELGSETTTGFRTQPVAVKQITDATSATSGGYHSCAVLAGGKVACWGDNTNGELGDGTLGEALTQVPVHGITDATQVTAGNYHSCAVLVVGTVQCWGDNSYGELGDGTSQRPDNCQGDSCSPTPVAASGITTASQVTASEYQSCALLAAGNVDCWGDNGDGQLGDGTTTNRSTPVAVGGITTATQIAAGAFQSCALLAVGSVDCWGYNLYGQLGNGTTTSSSTPVTVTGITTATQITAGADHTCALLAAGTVDCWGNNYYGQLGNGTTTSSSTPVTVTGISTAAQITAGYYNTCALLAGGHVDCWGYNFDGELGDGTAAGPETCGLYDDPCSTAPVPVSGITTARQISAGGDPAADSDGGHACAVLTDGAVRCWGANFDGQLGDGTAGYSVVPVLGRTAVVVPVSGVVSVEIPRKLRKTGRAAGSTPGSVAAATNSGFVRLTGTRQIPIGSRIDAHSGTIQLITATGHRHQTQSGKFGGGAFTLQQSTNKDQAGLTTLTLLTGASGGGPGYSVCAAPKPKSRAIGRTASHTPLSSRVLQTLRASVHGSFRTKGKYSAATVRGTVWDTIDRCDGTLTIVHAGTVLVTDSVTHKTIVVHAGHSFLAKAT